MKNNLQNKVALVTGASKGIGASIAKGLAEAGAKVVVNYASSKEGADKVVGEIQSKGGEAIAVKARVNILDEVKFLIAQTKDAYGQLDIVVNNAGVYKLNSLKDTTEEDYRWQYDINILGTLSVTNESLKLFTEQGGSIINVSSVAGSKAFPVGGLYGSTKAALNALTASWAQELGPQKIRVNAISPGMIETEGTQGIGIIGSDFETESVKNTPLGRIGQPDDVAKVAVFLASDESFWISGEDIKVAGGFA